MSVHGGVTQQVRTGFLWPDGGRYTSYGPHSEVTAVPLSKALIAQFKNKCRFG